VQALRDDKPRFAALVRDSDAQRAAPSGYRLKASAGTFIARAARSAAAVMTASTAKAS
jgi:hypothetical protein